MRLGGGENFGTSEIEENADGTAGGIVERRAIVFGSFKPNGDDEIGADPIGKVFDKHLIVRMVRAINPG